MKQKDGIFMLVAIICIIVFSVAIAPVTLQNDTFYTIKIGQFILENGVTEYDPFSWHDGLLYTFPHWLYDVLIGGIYNIGGLFGIYISTILLTITLGVSWFLTNYKLSKNKLSSFALAMTMLYFLEPFITARAQLVTFIIFVFEIFFIERFLETKGKKYAIGLIILPIIIVNVHLAVFPFYFVLFMPYVGEYVIALLVESPCFIRNLKIKKILKKIKNGKIIENLGQEKIDILKNKNEISKNKMENRRKNAYKLVVRKNDNCKWLIVIMIVCVFAGLLTPLGDTPYTYLIKTLQGNTTKNIAEHLPTTIIEYKPEFCFMVLLIVTLIFTKTKVRLCDVFMCGGLIYLALSSRRQLSMFSLICLGIFNKWVAFLIDEYDKNGFNAAMKFFNNPKGIAGLVTLSLIICIPFVKYRLDDHFIDSSSYPVEACDYILENLDTNEITLYNEYNFGSYLIYRGIPVFIDSRADLYTPEFNEGVDIFTDYMKISCLDSNYMEVFEKYNFTHALIGKNSRFDLMLQKDDDFKMLYEDEHFVLYEIEG